MSTDVSRRRVLAAGAALAGSAALVAGAEGGASAATAPAGAGKEKSKVKPTIVLVHGGYADSSCWNATIGELQDKGYTTVAGSNPLRGIPTDAAYIASLLDSISGPVVLVAHSMGGTVITNAAAGKANVKALVYIAAFVPEVGETQGELITKFPGSEVQPVSVPVPYTKADGTTGTDLYLSKDGHAAFAADISTADFRVLQATQRPFDADSFVFPTTAAAWKTIPVWGLVAGRDKAIPGLRALDVPARERPQDRRGPPLLPRGDAQPPEDRRRPHPGRREGRRLTRTPETTSAPVQCHGPGRSVCRDGTQLRTGLPVVSDAGTNSVLSCAGWASDLARGPWNRYARPKPAVTTAAPPTASRTQWLPVATIAVTVKKGCRRPRAFIHHFGARAKMTTPHHRDQPKCRDGIAAYWLVSAVSVP